MKPQIPPEKAKPSPSKAGFANGPWKGFPRQAGLKASPAYRPAPASTPPRLIGPPVYRPAAAAQAKLTAPPAYRAVASSTPSKPAGPAVYRPGASAQARLAAPASRPSLLPSPIKLIGPAVRPVAPAQAKLTAPPVYRPVVSAQSKLNAPAIRRSPAVSSPQRTMAVPSKQPIGRRPDLSAPPARVAQPFKVLGSDKLLARMPAKRPWFGYPYAVVGTANFPAQALRAGAGAGEEFLDAAGGANIVNAGAGMSLRVSDDNRMAIEDSDLEQRQPKAFYATVEVIRSANTQLVHVRSSFRLRQRAGSIRILTGWSGTETLYKVDPEYLPGGWRHNPDLAPQNCNLIAQTVTGIGMLSGVRAEQAASQIAGYGNGPTDAEGDRLRPGRYIAHSVDELVRGQRANQYALPDVGDAYVIATIGEGTPIADRPGHSLVYDIASEQERDLRWTYHFAGVVAQSGNDRITLENYARQGDLRVGRADPRWHFQMYGSSRRQSFHEFHKAKELYANPITVSIRNPRLPPLPAKPNLRALDIERARVRDMLRKPITIM